MIRIILTIGFCLLMLNSFGQDADYAKNIEKHREEYRSEFLHDPRSPLIADDLKHLHFFEPDPAFRVLADFKLLEGEAPFRMPTYDGSAKEYVRYGTASFTLNGKPLTLTIYRSIQLMSNEQYKDYLFLPFTDLTNGQNTYGGGRYIDLRTSSVREGQVEIDFNKAYNPYCAYSSGYSCPVPPEENDLPVAVTAGEKNYTGPKKKR